MLLNDLFLMHTQHRCNIENAHAFFYYSYWNTKISLGRFLPFHFILHSLLPLKQLRGYPHIKPWHAPKHTAAQIYQSLGMVKSDCAYMFLKEKKVLYRPENEKQEYQYKSQRTYSTCTLISCQMFITFLFRLLIYGLTWEWFLPSCSPRIW